jgi:Uma2 family endonuclease
MSLAEFVEWEARQEGRWEFDGFQPILMTGASALHNLIVGNLEFAIRRRLTPPCRIFRETLRLELSHTSRYPDLMVACGPRPDGNHLTDPILLVEVLSRSSFRTDRIHKNREYEATASMRRYIILEQDVTAAEVYAREGERWVRSTVVNEGVLVMPEIGVEVPLTEVYAELEVPLAEEKSDEPETA